MLVGHANDGAFEQATVAHGYFLDLVREYLEARHGDHVLLAVDNAHTALLVHHADVAGAEKSVFRHCFCGLIGPLPVACHDLRTARADLALLADRQFTTVVIADGDFGRGQRKTDGSGPFTDVAAVARKHRRGLGQAVTLDDRLAGGLHPGVGDGFLHGHTAADRALQHAPVDLAEIRVVEQRIVQRVHRRKDAYFVVRKLFYQHWNIARVRDQKA